MDWKRSKKMSQKQFVSGKAKQTIQHLDDSVSVKYALQLNVYKYILQTNYDLTVSDMFIVCFHPMIQSYLVVEVVDYSAEVADMLLTMPVLKQSLRIVQCSIV
jgi:hypothetical protein